MSRLSLTAHAVLPADLDPSTDQGRQWLSDELARTEYHDTRSLFQRLMDWLVARVTDLQSAEGTGGVSLPPVVIAVVVGLIVVVVLYLLTKVRVEHRTVTERTTLLGDSTQSVEELRREAEEGLTEGRFGAAVLAWTRAMARDAERRTLLVDAPSMTAHEVGVALGVAFPGQRAEIGRTVDIFDAVAYGDRAATRQDALLARSTDETLRTVRPTLPQRAPDVVPEDGEPPAKPRVAADSADAISSTGSSGSSVWMTGVGS